MNNQVPNESSQHTSDVHSPKFDLTKSCRYQLLLQSTLDSFSRELAWVPVSRQGSIRPCMAVLIRGAGACMRSRGKSHTNTPYVMGYWPHPISFAGHRDRDRYIDLRTVQFVATYDNVFLKPVGWWSHFWVELPLGKYGCLNEIFAKTGDFF